MRLKMVTIGISCILLAIPSYTVVPSLITDYMNKFGGGNSPSPIANQIFSQLGIPPIDTMVKFIQYSFVGLIVAGIGITVFGAIAKKMPKQLPVRLAIDSDQIQEASNLKALQLLQERLAKGEITSSQYQDLKKVLEDRI